MPKRIGKSILLFVVLNCLIAFVLTEVQAQELAKPIRGVTLLSGNFGELRASHFHSGIDIKTGGVEGKPVICIADGVLSRVAVSPVGYGLAVYIDHPDGTTSVYGHLNRFEPVLATLVRNIQYEKESFRIDENMLDYQLHYRKGDTIAYSGNSGSSGGPHLHFEIRNTRTENTLNPSLYYKVRDGKAPLVKGLVLYAMAENGWVENIRTCPVKSLGAGRYTAARSTVPAGKIGIGVHALDYMEDSWNKLGVYTLEMVVGSDTLYRLTMDSCSFFQSRLIHAVKDFDRYRKRETVYRCFGSRQQELMGVAMQGDGTVWVARDSVVKVQVSVADINGNCSRLTFELKGGEAVPSSLTESEILKCDTPYVLEKGLWRVELGGKALFSPVERMFEIGTDSATGCDIVTLARKETPLCEKACLSRRGIVDRRMLICQVAPDGRKTPLPTRCTLDGLSAEIGSLGRCTLVRDTLAPVITYMGVGKGNTLRFRIKDDISGIAVYRGEVDGKWCLFSYDPRTGILQCRRDEPVFTKGAVNIVKITVEDNATNRKELSVNVTIP